MEGIQKKTSEQPTARGITLADRLRELEEKVRVKERAEETKRKTKAFTWPFKWRKTFMKAKRLPPNKILVIFLNKKNEIEIPKLMPIFDGNMIVWNNKPYEFDPRAIWTIKGIKGNPRCYLIKEIDRRPVKNKFGKYVYGNASVSNLDIDEIRNRGDSTESDEFLIKAAIRAFKSQQKAKPIPWAVLLIVGAVVFGIIWFLSKGGA